MSTTFQVACYDPLTISSTYETGMGFLRIGKDLHAPWGPNTSNTFLFTSQD